MRHPDVCIQCTLQTKWGINPKGTRSTYSGPWSESGYHKWIHSESKKRAPPRRVLDLSSVMAVLLPSFFRIARSGAQMPEQTAIPIPSSLV